MYFISAELHQVDGAAIFCYTSTIFVIGDTHQDEGSKLCCQRHLEYGRTLCIDRR